MQVFDLIRQFLAFIIILCRKLHKWKNTRYYATTGILWKKRGDVMGVS